MLIYKFCRRKHTHTHIHSHAENHVWREPRKSNGNSAVTTNFGKYVLNDWPNCNSEGNEFFFLTKMRDISTLIHFYNPIRLLFVWKSILFTLRYHGQKAQILILNWPRNWKSPWLTLMCKGLFEQCYIFHKQFNVVFLMLVSETDLFTKGKEISQAAFNATEVRYREISKGIVQTNQGKNRLYKRYTQVQLHK